MSNANSFVRIYKQIASNKIVRDEEIIDLYWDLQNRIGNIPDFICKQHNKSHEIKKNFVESVPSNLNASLAIDSVAHAIHQGGEEILQKIYPSADYVFIKKELDALAGNDAISPVRQVNRGYFNAFFTEDTGFVQLEKQEKHVGRTIKEDILPAIKEYENLFKAGLISKAELLTLFRFYPDEPKYAQAVIKMGLDQPGSEPLVIGGPASVEMIDKEGHLIPTEVLDDAFRRFMLNFRGRNLNILHSDAQCGWVLPAYISKSGYIYKSGVDDKQLWCIGEIRDDVSISKKVREEIENGSLRSYSIAGSGKDIEKIEKNGKSYSKVGGLDLLELSICSHPANEGAVFNIIKSDDNQEEKTEISIDEIVDVISEHGLEVPGFYVYLDDSETPKIIIKTDRTNSLIENIISEIREEIDGEIPIEILSEELMTGEEIPIFRVILEPIGIDESNSYVDVSENLNIKNGGTIDMSKNALEVFNEMIQKQKKEKERNILKDHESRMEKFEQFRKELGMPDVKEEDFSKPFKHNFPNANIVTNNYDEKDKPHDVEKIKRVFRDLSK